MAGTLSGTTTVAAVSGSATFSNLSINKSGTGYTLAAPASGLTGRNQQHLQHHRRARRPSSPSGTQPSNTAAGSTITPAVTSRSRTSRQPHASTANVTLAIGANPGSGTLSRDASPAAVSASATFSEPVDQQDGHRLHARRLERRADRRDQQHLQHHARARRTRSCSSQQPTTDHGDEHDHARRDGADARRATTTSRRARPTITLAIGTNPGAGTLSGTHDSCRRQLASATFSDLSINKTGTGYTLDRRERWADQRDQHRVQHHRRCCDEARLRPSRRTQPRARRSRRR